MKKLLLIYFLTFFQKALNTFHLAIFSKSSSFSPNTNIAGGFLIPKAHHKYQLVPVSVKKYALPFMLAGSFLLLGLTNANAANSMGGGTTGMAANLNTSQTNIAILGFHVTTTSNSTVNGFNLSVSSTAGAFLNTYFSSLALYHSTSATFSLTTGTIATQITAAAFFGLGTTTPSVGGFTDIVNNRTEYYYIVATYTLPAATDGDTFILSLTRASVTTGNVNSPVVPGPTYTIPASVSLGTATTTGLATATQLNSTQGPVGILGFSVTTTSNQTITSMAFSATLAPASTIGTFFSGVTLYANTTNSFIGALPVTAGYTVSALTGTTFNITGLSQTINNSTVYYFIQANYTQPSSGSTTFQLSAASVTSLTPKTYTNGGPIPGISYTLTVLIAHTYDWTGAVSTAWANPQNWNIAGVQQTVLYPGSAITGDVADIGVNYNYTTNQPIVTTTLPFSVGSINLGANNGTAITLTVTGVTLTVTGAITQNHNTVAGNISTLITGTGTLNCGSLSCGDPTNTPPPPSGSFIYPYYYNFDGRGDITNTALVNPTSNLTTINSSLAVLTINGNLKLNSTSSVSGNYNPNLFIYTSNYSVNNAAFNLISGALTVNNIITSNSNYVNNTDGNGTTIKNSTSYQQAGGNTNTLNLLGNTPITFVTGAVIDFVTGTAGVNSYVNYQAASGTQTVYTSADAINTTPSAYANLSLSAASAKTVDGGTLSVGENLNTSGGAVSLNANNPTVTVAGSWTNATTTTQGTGNITITGSVTNNSGGTLALGSANFYIGGSYTNNIGGVYTQSTGTTYFNGTGAQALVDNSTTGTTFNNVTFNGTGTSTMSAGTNNVNFAVSSSGMLTMTSPAKLVAGSGSAAYLTLNSDATGSAAVAPITYTTPISGYVNVQRYLTGNRGYRLISSPVYAGNAGSYNVYSLNYLYNSLYITGTGGTAAGFTAGGNPTLYLYDEGFTPQYSTFLNSNFIGISSLITGTGGSPTYPVNANGGGLFGSFSLPVGTGFLCFFRGNLSEGASNLTNPSFSAVSATTTATGNLVQGQVSFRDWYNTPTTSLGSSKMNFNLIGNPYASAIDLGTIPTATTTSKIYATPYNSGTNTGIAKFIYELNPLSHVFGVYTDDNSLPATNGASEFIASGQAFFVLAYGSGTQFIFNETGKASSTNATATNGLMVTKADLATLNQSAANPLLKLQFVLDSINNEESVIEFNPSSRAQYTINEDATHRTGQGLLNFASMSSDNVPLAVNSLPLQKTMSIPLSVEGSPDGLYKINMQQVVALPGLYDIWLIDSYKKDSLDIKAYHTYSFDILHSDTASFGANRFKLVVRQNPALMVHLLNFGATKVTSGDQVIWTTENEDNYTSFAVERSTNGGSTFTALGSIASSGIGTYTLLDKNPVLGANAYRLKMTDLNGTVSYSNVVTLMYANTGNQIAVNGFKLYPNPTSGQVNLAINAPVQTGGGGAYTIQIINNLGAIVKTAISNQSTWQTDVSNLMPGTYFVQVKNNSTNNLVGKSAFVKL